MQSFIAETLFKAEQTWVVVKAQTLPIFITIAQNKGNLKSVSILFHFIIDNLYIIKPISDSKCVIYLIKDVFNTENSQNLKSWKKEMKTKVTWFNLH